MLFQSAYQVLMALEKFGKLSESSLRKRTKSRVHLEHSLKYLSNLGHVKEENGKYAITPSGEVSLKYYVQGIYAPIF